MNEAVIAAASQGNPPNPDAMLEQIKESLLLRKQEITIRKEFLELQRQLYALKVEKRKSDWKWFYINLAMLACYIILTVEFTANTVHFWNH